MKVDKRLFFSTNSEDFVRLENVLKAYPKNAEDIINHYLENIGKEKLIEKATFYIPISVNPSKDRKTHHAKKNKWYETAFKNLEIDLSNSSKGTRKSSYYYLYYVANYTGTSDPRKQKTGVGGIDFFTKGAEMAYPNIKEDLIDLLSKKIKEEL